MRSFVNPSVERTCYAVVVVVDGGRQMSTLYKEYAVALAMFYKHLAILKSKTRVRTGRDERSLIIRCALHKIYDKPVIESEDLNSEALLLSSDNPFTRLDLSLVFHDETKH